MQLGTPGNRERERQTDREEEEAEEERSEIHTSPAMCDSRMLGFTFGNDAVKGPDH